MLPARQPELPLPRALPPQRRDISSNLRRSYRLPHAVRDRLQAALEPFRNGERAYALAVFLGRFWSVPGRLALPFPIDRRALADREDLALTEGEVRGALKTLETIGFLARWKTVGSRYKATEEGLRRKPVPFTFGPDYMPAFVAANKRAAAVRGVDPSARRSQPPDRASRASVATEGAFRKGVSKTDTLLKQSCYLPKDKAQAEAVLLMGEGFSGRHRDPQAEASDSRLESALGRLSKAFADDRAQRESR